MIGWNTDTKDFAKVVAEFETALPGFWWRVGRSDEAKPFPAMLRDLLDAPVAYLI